MRASLFVCGLVLAFSSLSECRSIDKIVGGEEASPHEFPYQVSLRRKSDNFHFCGGSVLSPHYVVSAAHCTVIWDSASEVMVVAGDHCQSKDDGTEQTVDVVSLTVHENYGSPKSFENDIAVWKLAEPLIFNEAVSAIALPTKIEDPVADMTVTGWGTTSAGGSTPDCLMKVDVPFVTDARCKIEYPFSIADSMICAGEHGKDSCQGDSGGPLTGYKDGERFLAGIVSWGRGCGGWFAPGVYTEVSYQLDWLAAHTVEPTVACNFVGANPIPGEGCAKDFYCCAGKLIDGKWEWSHKTCTCQEGSLFDPDDFFCNKNCDVMEYLGFTRGDHICEDGETCHT